MFLFTFAIWLLLSDHTIHTALADQPSHADEDDMARVLQMQLDALDTVEDNLIKKTTGDDPKHASNESEDMAPLNSEEERALLAKYAPSLDSRPGRDNVYYRQAQPITNEEHPGFTSKIARLLSGVRGPIRGGIENGLGRAAKFLAGYVKDRIIPSKLLRRNLRHNQELPAEVDRTLNNPFETVSNQNIYKRNIRRNLEYPTYADSTSDNAFKTFQNRNMYRRNLVRIIPEVQEITSDIAIETDQNQ